MRDFYSRTYGIFGDKLENIKRAHIAVVGLGGVGGSAAIGLARSGVGKLTLIDGDFVVESNLNRQSVSYISTLGMNKAEAANKLIKDINEDIDVCLYNLFWTKDADIDLSGVDYILDCIDSVKDKVDLIAYAKGHNIPIISSMGAGNKLDPTMFKVADISKTSVDPLARVMRKKLKDMGINHVKVVFSEEIPRTPFARPDEQSKGDYQKRNSPASFSAVPPVVGLIMSAEVLKDISNI